VERGDFLYNEVGVLTWNSSRH